MNRLFHNFDWFFVIPVLSLTMMSMITMIGFYHSNIRLVTEFLLFKHGLSIILGVGIALLVSLLDYRVWQGISRSLFISITVILGLLLILGSTIKGSQSWFSLGGFGIQPVEFAKVVTILLMAKYLATYHRQLNSFWTIISSGIPVFVIILLVLLQPDFGSASIIVLIWLGMIFLGGIRAIHGITLILGGLSVFGVLWTFIFKPYQKLRILTFLDPTSDPLGAGYNTLQAIRSIASGGLTGQGITTKAPVIVPEVHTDFIFAGFSQGWGFIGASVYFFLVSVIIWRLISLAAEVQDIFGRMIVLGVLVTFVAQTVINIGMNLGLLPITGIPLPFMSYGGSSMMGFFLMVGLILSIQKHRQSKGTIYMKDSYDMFG